MDTTQPATAIAPQRNGFTLVELSIVLVIIGLLVGGIMVGADLIKAGRIQSGVSEIERFKSAFHGFRDKYMAFPGDITNATQFWGTAAACPGLNNEPSTDATTCNGDGDRVLEWSVVAPQGNEYFRFWQHLKNAGLVEGQFSGVRGTGNAYHSIGDFNVPTSKLAQACYSAVHHDAVAGNAEVLDTGYVGIGLSFGAQGTASSCRQPVFTPQQVWQIDLKVDDGKPGQGMVKVRYWDDCTNAADSTGVSSDYLLTSEEADCAMQIHGF